MDEREFYTEKSQIKHATYTCPKCHETAEFEIHWLHRMKRKTLPPGADDRDRAKFAKAGDYLVRVDEYLVCPNPRSRSPICRRWFSSEDEGWAIDLPIRRHGKAGSATAEEGVAMSSIQIDGDSFLRSEG